MLQAHKIMVVVHGGDLYGIALAVIPVQLDVGRVQHPFPTVTKSHILADGVVDLRQTLIVIESKLAIVYSIDLFFLEPEIDVMSFLINEEFELLKILGLTEY